jgi:hypothetical protein
MSLWLFAGCAWLGFAILGWSWLAMAARADRQRARSRQPPRAPQQPRSRTHA